MAMTRILILTTIVAGDRKRGREKDGLNNTPEPVLRVKFNQAAKAVERDLTKAA